MFSHFRYVLVMLVGAALPCPVAFADDEAREEASELMSKIAAKAREGFQRVAAAADSEDKQAIEALLQQLEEIAKVEDPDEQTLSRILEVTRQLNDYLQPDSPLDPEYERKLSPYRMRLEHLVGFLFIHGTSLTHPAADLATRQKAIDKLRRTRQTLDELPRGQEALAQLQQAEPVAALIGSKTSPVSLLDMPAEEAIERLELLHDSLAVTLDHYLVAGDVLLDQQCTIEDRLTAGLRADSWKARFTEHFLATWSEHIAAVWAISEWRKKERPDSPLAWRYRLKTDCYELGDGMEANGLMPVEMAEKKLKAPPPSVEAWRSTPEKWPNIRDVLVAGTVIEPAHFFESTKEIIFARRIDGDADRQPLLDMEDVMKLQKGGYRPSPEYLEAVKNRKSRREAAESAAADESETPSSGQRASKPR